MNLNNDLQNACTDTVVNLNGFNLRFKHVEPPKPTIEEFIEQMDRASLDFDNKTLIAWQSVKTYLHETEDEVLHLQDILDELPV